MSWKYIVFSIDVPGTASRPGGKQVIPIIFAPELSHKDMADATLRAFSRDRIHADPVSAGFVSFKTDDGMPTVVCWGDSESLHMESKADDALVILEVGNRNPFYYPGDH